MALRFVLLAWGVLALGCGPGERPDGGRPADGEGDRGEAAAARGGGEDAPAPGAPVGEGGSDARPVLLFFGTSLTAGYGLDDPGRGFPGRIAEMLDSAGLGYRVVEAGVPGETSAAGVRRIGWVLDDRPVRVAVVELGANDALRGQDPDALRRNLAAVVDTIRARRPGARVVLAGMEAPPNLGARYADAFRSAYREVAREKDVVLLPFLLEGVAGIPEMNQDDRIHPDVRGHRRIADHLWEVLEPVLREAAAEPAVSLPTRPPPTPGGS